MVLNRLSVIKLKTKKDATLFQLFWSLNDCLPKNKRCKADRTAQNLAVYDHCMAKINKRKGTAAPSSKQGMEIGPTIGIQRAREVTWSKRSHNRHHRTATLR